MKYVYDCARGCHDTVCMCSVPVPEQAAAGTRGLELLPPL